MPSAPFCGHRASPRSPCCRCPWGLARTRRSSAFVNAVLLKPLPFPDAGRVVVVREQPQASDDTVAVHPQNFLEWRSRVRAFEAIAIVQRPPVNVVGRDGTEQVSGANVTTDLFRVFGLPPIVGRAFTAADATPGSEPVAVLGYGYWTRRFGRDRAVVGRRLTVSDGSLTIVGVASPDLKLGLTEPDVYTPLTIDPSNPGAVGSRSFECYARLRPVLRWRKRVASSKRSRGNSAASFRSIVDTAHPSPACRTFWSAREGRRFAC